VVIAAAWGWCYLPPGEDERSWSRDMLASGCSKANNRRGLSKEKKAKNPIKIQRRVLTGLLCGCMLAFYNVPGEGAERQQLDLERMSDLVEWWDILRTSGTLQRRIYRSEPILHRASAQVLISIIHFFREKHKCTENGEF